MSGSSTEFAARQMEDWARAEFPDLSPGEILMVRSACSSEPASYGPSTDEPIPEFSERGNVSKNVKPWGSERNVRGTVIRWLCVNQKAKVAVDPRGIQLVGARIIGKLDKRLIEHAPGVVAMTQRGYLCSLIRAD